MARLSRCPERGSAPAQRFVLPDGTTFGIIPSTTTPFCSTCDRSRVTADGMWYRCLYATTGTDLRKPLRAGHLGSGHAGLDSGRLGSPGATGAQKSARHWKVSGCANPELIGIDQLREDPHLEMHARGG